MSRWQPVDVAFVGLALPWGVAAAILTGTEGWSWLIALAAVAGLAGGFGWLRRGREIGDVFVPAFVLAYVAIAGLALTRLAQAGAFDVTGFADTSTARWAPIADPYAARWPAILLGGIPLALTCAIFVALPLSVLPRRRPPPREADEQFWAFVRAQNAAREMQDHRITG